jgi:hypothetical protein
MELRHRNRRCGAEQSTDDKLNFKETKKRLHKRE